MLNQLGNNKSDKANLWDLIAAAGHVILNEIHINFSARVTFKFDRWPQETIGNLFHGPKSYASHFIAIHEFKLEMLKSEPNHWFFSPCDLEMWPSEIIGLLFYATSSFVHHFKVIFKFELKI